MTLKRKPSGYWNDNRIIRELESIIEDLGYFPSGLQLKEMNKSDLQAAINNRGGLIKFRVLLRNKGTHWRKSYIHLGEV